MLSEQKTLTLSATGDSLITRSCRQINDANFKKMVEIIRSSEVNFTNLEILLNHFKGSPSAFSGGTWVSTHPRILEELKWMGFNTFAWGNNHTLDWSEEGLLRTLKVLEDSGVLYAGAGRHLYEARKPNYMDVSSGHVAMVAMTSTFTPGAQAGRQSNEVQGRPGINPLRLEETIVLEQDEFDWMKQIVEKYELNSYQKRMAHLGLELENPDQLKVFNRVFEVGKPTGIRLQVETADRQENLQSIRDARRQADWVIASIHTHEQVGADREQIPEFLEKFAHECIDAGADIVLGHGPHLLRGMEIYKNRPILYSLGNFFFENELVQLQPADAYDSKKLPQTASVPDLMDFRSEGGKGFQSDPLYWESIVVTCVLSPGGVKELRLYPIELGYGKGRTKRGQPRLVSGEKGKEIIQRMNDLSSKYHAFFEWNGQYGELQI